MTKAKSELREFQDDLFKRLDEWTSEQDRKNDKRFAKVNSRFTEVNSRLDQMDNNISHLPTKDEFYESQDKLMKEVKDTREEQTIIAHQLRNHEDRISVLESKFKN